MKIIGYTFDDGIYCECCSMDMHIPAMSENYIGEVHAYTVEDAIEANRTIKCDSCHEIIWEKRCPNCDDPLELIREGPVTTYFCPGCKMTTLSTGREIVEKFLE